MREFISAAYKLYEDDAAEGGNIDKTSSPANNAISSYLFLQKILLDGDVNKDSGLSGEERIEARKVTIEAGGSPLNLGGSFVPSPKDDVLNIKPIYTESEVLDTYEDIDDLMKSGQYSNYIRVGDRWNDNIENKIEVMKTNVNCWAQQSTFWFGADAYAFIKTIPEALDLSQTTKDKKDVVYLNYNAGETDEDAAVNDSGLYMRWGHLLHFINDNVIPIIEGSDENDSKPTPVVNIDFDMWGNKMYTLPYQVSLDPRVCIVKSADDINSKKYFPELIAYRNTNKEYAWTMNIYLSHNQILASLNENLDEKGNIALFGFLESLCIAVNKAMGGINNLEPFLDEDTNTLYIVDASYQPKPKPYPYVMQLYGYNSGSQNQAGFVRNFNLKTEITNEFATMASIGSTAGGYIKGTENTMFSKWNRGLRDRWKEKYVVPDKESRHKDGEVDEPNKMYVKEFWNQRYSAFGLTLMDVADDLTGYDDQGALNDDVIDSNIEIVTEFYKYIQAEIHKEKSGSYSSPSNGFIPINLGITMDGIAGIKIYNEVNVNTSFLPSNYPDSLRFIIKGVNHKLSDGDWETTLETVVISKSNDKSNPPLTQVEIKEIMDRYIKEGISSSGGSTGGAPGGSGGGTGGGSNYLYTPPPTVAGAWEVTKGGKKLAKAEDLTKHHSYDDLEPDPNQISGGWSKRNGRYVYDMVLYRTEDGVRTKNPFVPSPVAGKIIKLGYYTNGKDSAIHIKSTQTNKVYILLHCDVKNALVRVGDTVKYGQLLARQSDEMDPGKFARNIHLHIAFPNLDRLKKYIIDLVTDDFPK